MTILENEGSEHQGEGLLTIGLDAVSSNYVWLRDQLGGNSRCAAVVKADAYGLGVAPVAQALHRAGCRDFFVATQAEGEQLQALLAELAGDSSRVFVLTGVRPGRERACAEAGLIPVLVTLDQLRQWCALTAVDAPSQLVAPCALKLDSGMTRLGMCEEEFAQLLAMPELLQKANLQLILSHLACADEPAHPQNKVQLDAFRGAVSQLRRHCPEVEVSLANSSGICLGRDYHFDLVRPGSALYGVNPIPGQKNPMAAVVNLRLPVLQQRQVTRVSTVGYGATEAAAAGSWLAVVRGGYADGILRAQSGRGCGMAIAGSDRIRVPMLGRVSMDTTVFDISVLTRAQREQLRVIEVLGGDLTVDHMGAAADTIGYEILTALGRRYHRRYL